MQNTTSHPKSKYFVFTYDIIMPVLIILLVLIGFWVTLKSNAFAVKEIKCSLDYQPCMEGPVAAELKKYLGSNLIRLETGTIKTRLLSGDFTIRNATFHKKLPNTLVVDMQSVYPVAAAQVRGVENEWIVFDELFRVIGIHLIDPNVPTVLLDESPSVHIGEKIEDKKTRQALTFARTIATELSIVHTIALEKETLTLALDGGKTALFSITKDQSEQIRTLQSVLADTTISSGVSTIDVRFTKPVIR